MRRRLALGFGLVLVCAGCGLFPGGTVEIHDPNATYVIKIRPKQKGDRFDVTETIHSSSVHSTVDADGVKKVLKDEKEEVRIVYSEVILGASEDSPLPTRLRRTYQTAKYTDPKGEKHNLSIADKSVWIEKKPSGYTYILEGGAYVSGPEGGDLHLEFGPAHTPLPEEVVPAEAVGVNKPWDLKPDLVKTAARIIDLPVEFKKSKGTAQLVRVQKKAGQIWGELELRIEFPSDRILPGGGRVEANATYQVTYHMPIDGSSFEGTRVVHAVYELQTPKGGPPSRVFEQKQEWTFTPSK